MVKKTLLITLMAAVLGLAIGAALYGPRIYRTGSLRLLARG